MINVILIHPDGEEFDAQLDETGNDTELQQDIISALGLEGSFDDLEIRLVSGIKLSEGCRIKVERRRASKVRLIPRVAKLPR
jgi:hypothetical protein